MHSNVLRKTSLRYGMSIWCCASGLNVLAKNPSVSGCQSAVLRILMLDLLAFGSFTAKHLLFSGHIWLELYRFSFL